MLAVWSWCQPPNRESWDPCRPRAAKAAAGIAWHEKGGRLHRKNQKIFVEYPMHARLEKEAFEELCRSRGKPRCKPSLVCGKWAVVLSSLRHCRFCRYVLSRLRSAPVCGRLGGTYIGTYISSRPTGFSAVFFQYREPLGFPGLISGARLHPPAGAVVAQRREHAGAIAPAPQWNRAVFHPSTSLFSYFSKYMQP